MPDASDFVVADEEVGCLTGHSAQYFLLRYQDVIIFSPGERGGTLLFGLDTRPAAEFGRTFVGEAIRCTFPSQVAG